jgi:adenosylmethionine-8-amino-7-oxononanoate aminotransferase
VPNRRDIYAPYISDAFQHVPSPTYKRSSLPHESEEAYSVRLAGDLEAKILSLGADKVAAFYAEPVVGTALGVMPPPRGYFPAISAVLKKYSILLVMDEVMCGAGRSGSLYAWDRVAEGVVPDIQSMAKGLGAGYAPISAVLAGHRVVDAVRAAGVWKNSHTYQNHPITCAVALAVLRKMERLDLYNNVLVRGAQLAAQLKAAVAPAKTVYDIRAQGLFLGIEFEAPQSLAPRFALRVKAQCFANGLVTLGMAGTVDGVAKGDSLVLAPAYIVTEAEIARIVEIVAKSVLQVEAEIGL